MRKIINTNIGIVIICLFCAVCVMADFIVIDKALDSFIVNNEVKIDDESLENNEIEYVRNTSIEIDGGNYGNNFTVNIKDGNISLLDNFISNNATTKNLVIESGNAKYVYLKKGSHCVSNNLFYITDDNKLYMFKFPYEYIINILSRYGTLSEVIEQNKLVLIAENAVDFVGNDDNHVVKYLDLNGNIKEYNYYTESFKEEEFIFIGKRLHQLTAGIYFSGGPLANYDVYYAFDEYNNAYEIDQFNAGGLDIYNLMDVDYIRGILTKTGFDNYCNKNKSLIVESQGNYYHLSGNRGANISYYKSEFEIVDINDSYVKYKVHNYYVNDYADLGKSYYEENELNVVTYDFVLEKEDGVWKVSQFTMFK